MEQNPSGTSAPERDAARHTLTIKQASQLFAELGVPRAPRSVQRFCEHEYLDCIRVKGAKGDQFFINRQSVERYAEELRQIEAIASIGVGERPDAPQRDRARNSAQWRADTPDAVRPEPERHHDAEPNDPEKKRLQDENLNLRIDNRAKEIAIAQLSSARAEDQEKFLSAMQDMSYRLGAAETQLAQLEAPKAHDDAARQSASSTDATPEGAVGTPPTSVSEQSSGASTAPMPEPRPSFIGRLFR